MRACVASILELPLEDVPNYNSEPNWWDLWQRWLAERNLVLYSAEAAKSEGWFPPGYSILVGKSPRGEWNHAVVCLDGEMVHDPHPQKTGVLSKIEWDFFGVLDPAQPVGANYV